MNIAIDGPAGSGKSTIAKKLAAGLGCVYADTGAMYRAMALLMLRKNISLKDEDAVAAAAELADIRIEYREGSQRVLLDGEDVTGLLREEKVGEAASRVSVYKPVRKKLVELQQRLAAEVSVVMDGRDIGTVVLPDAEVKIFLTADPEVRARRRYLELLAKKSPEEQCDLTDQEKENALLKLKRDIIERDERDMSRKVSPLKKADDAILLDTSDLSINEVTSKILQIVRSAESVQEGKSL